MVFQNIAFRSWHWFLNDFGSNMLPFLIQKSIKIFPKFDPKRHVFSDNNLHRFLESTCFHFPPPDPPKSHLELVLKCIVYHIDFNIVFFQRFWKVFGSQHGTQKAVGGCGWNSGWNAVRPSEAPKAPQDAPRCVQDTPRTLPGRLKTPPRSGKFGTWKRIFSGLLLKLDLGSSLGSILGGHCFGMCFGWF